ncbi:hypothetical protein PX699_02895 [Sphingobium sp. H39-3-25]|uniref:hypothetical protein n=1 Tax=Sphingobium arseniciresistens TaxID=3030834 RepID=UPI0023B9D9E2|nr:hypothetical protein [Sphingobium arseniciresistens]
MIDIMYLETRLRSARAMAARAADGSTRALHREMAEDYARRLAAIHVLNPPPPSASLLRDFRKATPHMTHASQPSRIAA